MIRSLYTKLISWKNSNKRKPLLVQGARQVGKTYLINEFGRKEYSNIVYLNFEQNPNLETLFDNELKPEKIVDNISLYLGRKITSTDTLIFFDEIQIAPGALTSLKYFCEQAPNYNIIAAGSLLGVSLGKETSFPVGKVNFMTLYPMSFIEYLYAFEEDLLAENLLNNINLESFPEIIHEKLLSHLRMYLYLGGMPEVINSWLQTKEILEINEIFQNLMTSYYDDIT